jgi:hypothetical protein
VTTVTSSTGSGTSFNVADGVAICDGLGLFPADTITINGQTRTVTARSGNTVTVNSSLSWTLGDGVYIGADTTPDIGPLPYGSAELTAATITHVGTTHTVTVTGDAAGVWFYEDGVPTTWDATAPYQITSSAGYVSARVYALNAQDTPVVAATESGGGGGTAGPGRSTARRRKI